jgi:hypothetical protein
MRMMKKRSQSHQKAVKENQFELLEDTPLLGKISVYLPSTIQVRCLGWDQEQPALHNPDYDFPDDIITTGYLFSTT